MTLNPNQFALYHGTSLASANSILTDGFDTTRPSINGKRYGQAMYFTEDPAEAADYATDVVPRTGGHHDDPYTGVKAPLEAGAVVTAELSPDARLATSEDHGATVKANRDGEFLSDGTALHEHLKSRGFHGYKNSGVNKEGKPYSTVAVWDPEAVKVTGAIIK
jgi:hypothetical protein